MGRRRWSRSCATGSPSVSGWTLSATPGSLPMQRGALGARALNADLQEALNPNPPSRVERFGSVFLPGDKVMQTENDYDKEVFNGDLGAITRIDEEDGVLHVTFDGREVDYEYGELDRLVPAYATIAGPAQQAGQADPPRREILASDHRGLFRPTPGGDLPTP